MSSSTTSSNDDNSLGDRLESFEPKTSNIVAGYILAPLLVAGGAFLIFWVLRDAVRAGFRFPFWAERGMSWLAGIIFLLIGLGLIVGGWFLLRFVNGLRNLWVKFCTNGLEFRHGSSIENIAWSKITLIRETVMSAHLPIVKGPARALMPVVTNEAYTIITDDGKQFDFSENTIKDIKRFGRLLRDRTNPLGIKYEVVTERA